MFCPSAGHSLHILGTKAAVLPKGRSSTVNLGTKVAGMNRCGSFPLLSVPHTLFSIWTDLKRSEKFPGAQAWRWEECIRLTGPSGRHRNSPQGLNISSIRVFDQIRDQEIPITLRLHSYIVYHNTSPYNNLSLPLVRCFHWPLHCTDVLGSVNIRGYWRL